MKKKLEALLARLGQWLVARYDRSPNFPLPADIFPAIERAKILIDEVEATAPTNASGEYKRHQAYAKLIKEFGGLRHRWLSLALELAFCFGGKK